MLASIKPNFKYKHLQLFVWP